ncbi:MAG: SDR family NAD(P)-dependent oxidoreductase, partial [Beijerinckiaceae bacterium]
MTFRLDGRRALVMGATRGIGYGIAQAFAEAGAAVVLTGRRAEDAEAAAQRIGLGVAGIALDTADLSAVDAAAKAAMDRLGVIDVLVLNGGGPPPGSAMGVSSEQWRKYWDMMFVSLVRMADHLLPAMIDRKFGRVMSVVSSGV